MQKKVRGLVFEVDGTIRHTMVNYDIATQIVDFELLEDVSLRDDLFGYVSEEGKIQRLPINRTATAFVEFYRPGFKAHDIINGPMVVMGTNEEGDELDVPSDALEKAKEFFNTLTALPPPF